MVSWAAPCRVLGLEIEALAGSSGGRFGMFTLDAHLEEEAAASPAAPALPTVLILHCDRVVERFTGFRDAARLRSALIAAEYGRARRSAQRNGLRSAVRTDGEGGAREWGATKCGTALLENPYGSAGAPNAFLAI